jgi:hypothetical protein
MPTIIKLFCLFVILCVPEGVYQNPDFKIIIHLDESDGDPNAIPKVGRGTIGKLVMSVCKIC